MSCDGSQVTFANEIVGRLSVRVTFVSCAALSQDRGLVIRRGEGSGVPSARPFKSNAITPQASESVETLIKKATREQKY